MDGKGGRSRLIRFLVSKKLDELPYARHQKPRLVYHLPHFSGYPQVAHPKNQRKLSQDLENDKTEQKKLQDNFQKYFMRLLALRAT